MFVRKIYYYIVDNIMNITNIVLIFSNIYKKLISDYYQIIVNINYNV